MFSLKKSDDGCPSCGEWFDNFKYGSASPLDGMGGDQIISDRMPSPRASHCWWHSKLFWHTREDNSQGRIPAIKARKVGTRQSMKNDCWIPDKYTL
jgi:hypothetical protein